MVLNITGCKAASGGRDLIRDLSKFPSAYKLVKACLKGKTKYSPLDISVTWNGETYHFREAGKNTETSDLHLINLKAQHRKRIPNATIYISADILGQELYISLDGPPEPRGKTDT